ncbi:MAG TPA: MFS transporter [Steroidobacteraceae bacterium]|nr:MFS transporter [Steroidobacteraceae bacterium]
MRPYVDSMEPCTVSLESIVDAAALSPRQTLIIVLCSLVVMVDGFNTQSIAFAAPAIVAAWHVPAASFGVVFAAGLLGSLFGALAFGVLADRLGRKPSLVAAVLLFAAVNLIAPFTTSVAALTVVRLVSGFGLGGALPITLSLTSEYAPVRMRTTLVALMFCGFPLGAVLGGVGSAKLIPAFGWASMFYAGGLVPIALLPFVIGWIPESIRFLSVRQARGRIEQVLRRMHWLELWNGQLVPADTPVRSPVAALFAQGRAAATLLLWVTLFLSLLLTYFLVNWIPLIARSAGYDMTTAVLGVAALNLGAIAGCLIIGRLADRYGRLTRLLGVAFVLGAVAIGLIGASGRSSLWLLAAAFLAGVCSLGAQMCTVVYCANFYDTALRSTGVGWAIGIGRIGSIVGPAMGGILIAAGVTAGTLFVLIGAMSVGSGVAVLALGRCAGERRAAALA